MEEIKEEIEKLSKILEELSSHLKQKTGHLVTTSEEKEEIKVGDVVAFVEYRQIQQISVDKKDFVLQSIRGPPNQLLMEVDTHQKQKLPFYCPSFFSSVFFLNQEQLIHKFIHCSCPLIALEYFQPEFGHIQQWIVRKISLSEIESIFPADSKLVSTVEKGYTWVDLIKQQSEETCSNPPKFIQLYHFQIVSFIENQTRFRLR